MPLGLGVCFLVCISTVVTALPKLKTLTESTAAAVPSRMPPLPSATGSVPEQVEVAVADPIYRVSVNLKGLEAGPPSAERIARARERVMRAREGRPVEVNREYYLIPALSLTVDGEGLRILLASRCGQHRRGRHDGAGRCELTLMAS
jgi:hypothetical protein